MQHSHTSEEWRPVVGYEGFYEVSDHGRVRSVDRVVHAKDGRSMRYSGKMLSIATTRGNRTMVVLSMPGCRPWSTTVHKLVLTAFVGLCPEGMECCHWDDDPQNNYLSNLRWDTKSANARDKVRNGRDHNVCKTHCPAGHPYDAENTRRSGQHRAGRECKECSRVSNVRRYNSNRRATESANSWKPIIGGECSNGHEYTLANTYTYPDGAKRACRICKREASRVHASRVRTRDPEKSRAYNRAWRARRRAENTIK